MKYLHTMVRVTDIDASLAFYCDGLGLKELKRNDYPAGRFTLVFLAAPGDEEAQVELTFNWDPPAEPYGMGRAFGPDSPPQMTKSSRSISLVRCSAGSRACPSLAASITRLRRT